METAKRLCAEKGIVVDEIWSYHTIGSEVRFTLARRAPAKARTKRKAKAHVKGRTRAKARTTGKAKQKTSAKGARKRPARGEGCQVEQVRQARFSKDGEIIDGDARGEGPDRGRARSDTYDAHRASADRAQVGCQAGVASIGVRRVRAVSS